MTLARRHAAMAAVVVLGAAVSAGAIEALAMLSRHNMSASHLPFVPLVTIFLIWQERRRVFSSVESSVAAGAGLMAAGLVLSWVASPLGPAAQYSEALTIQIAGLVVLALGGFLACYGAAAFRRALFPLLFLLFTIPIPAVLLDVVTQLLKRGSTELVAVMFHAIGTPFYREAYVFSLPTLTIEVADACSGIRSTIALVLTMLLAGDMYLRTGWARIVLLLAIVPVTIFKNAVRIVGLSWLAMHVDRSFITGQLHHDGGIVFFLLALLMLSPVLGLLRRSEARRAVGGRAPQLEVSRA